MSNWYPCAICGISRYSHDVIAAPNIKSTARISEWEALIGKAAMNRIFNTRAHRKKAFICIEHFDAKKSFNKLKRMKREVNPMKISGENMAIYENYFQDHGYFDLYRSRLVQSKPSLMHISCSLCSMDVIRDNMQSHAESHAPEFMHIFDHLCEKHKKNESLIGTSECEECSHIQSKVAYELAKVEANRCFPMFEFYVNEQKLNEKIIYSLRSNIKKEYTKTRPLWKSDVNNIFQSNGNNFMDEELKQDVKLEPIDDFGDTDDFKEETENSKDEDYEPRSNETSSSSEEIAEEDDTGIDSLLDPISMEQRQMPLNILYDSDRHPSFEKMLKINDSIGYHSRFHTIFNFLETRRRLDGEVCSENDTCSLARKYIEMENQPVGTVLKDPDVTKRMVEMFEEHWSCGKFFDVGYSYLMAEKLGLPPKYLKKQYRKFTHRKSVAKIQNTKIQEFEENYAGVQDPNLSSMHVAFRNSSKRLPKNVVNILEQAYLQRKKVDPNVSWNKRIMKPLARQCELSSEQVHNWMLRRKLKETNHPERRHKFNDEELYVLRSSFYKSRHPTSDEYRQLADTLELTKSQVMHWFDTQRTACRKKDELMKLQKEFDQIPEYKTDILKKIADEQTKILMEDRIKLAKLLGVSYQVVTHWIEQYKNDKRTRKRRSIKIENQLTDDDTEDEENEEQYFEVNDEDKELDDDEQESKSTDAFDQSPQL